MEYNKPKHNDVHPTMKPVEMLVYLIKNSNFVIKLFSTFKRIFSAFFRDLGDSLKIILRNYLQDCSGRFS